MQILQKVLDEILKERGLSKKINEQRAILSWNEIVGKTVSQNAQPAKIVDGTLFVHVSNSVWAHKLSFFAHNYAAKINRLLNEEVVKEVKFSVGKVEPNEAETEDESSEVSLEQITLDQEELKVIEETVKSIEDLELRERLKEIITCQKKLSILRGLREPWKG